MPFISWTTRTVIKPQLPTAAGKHGGEGEDIREERHSLYFNLWNALFFVIFASMSWAVIGAWGTVLANLAEQHFGWALKTTSGALKYAVLITFLTVILVSFGQVTFTDVL